MNIAEKFQIQEERRLDHERRQFSYTYHIPERRSGEDRRFAMAPEPEKVHAFKMLKSATA